VVTVHDQIPWVLRHASYLRQRLRWAPQRRLLSHAARLLCDSQAPRATLLAGLPVDASRTRVVYPGVDEAFFTTPPAADVTTMRERYGPRFALFVGECDWRKRPEHALAVIAATDARLLIVGANARHASRLHRLAAEAGVSDRVSVAGFVSDRELLAAYAAASVLLFPSRYEGFGLPLLEAAAGRPSRDRVRELVDSRGGRRRGPPDPGGRSSPLRRRGQRGPRRKGSGGAGGRR